jgi:hypothetical protein
LAAIELQQQTDLQKDLEVQKDLQNDFQNNVTPSIPPNDHPSNHPAGHSSNHSPDFSPITQNQTPSISTYQNKKDKQDNNDKSLESNTQMIKIDLKKGISFEDVIGNFDAKQALYENVVLPLTVSNETKVKIFSG